MASSTVSSVPPFLPTLSSSKLNPKIQSLCFNLYPPFSPYNLNYPSITVSRSRFSSLAASFSGRVFRVNGLAGHDTGITPEPESDNSKVDATIDLRLPRRSLLVEFTCNSCGERTKRLVNRVAYERGSVFVQDVFGITN